MSHDQEKREGLIFYVDDRSEITWDIAVAAVILSASRGSSALSLAYTSWKVDKS